MGSLESSVQQYSGKPYSRRSYLLTCPRTASNLFVRMLNIHDRTDVATVPPFEGLPGGGYVFGKPVDFHDDNYGLETPIAELGDKSRAAIGAAFQKATDEFVGIVSSGEQLGKIIFFKEHICNMVKPALQTKILHGTIPISIEAPWTMHIDGYDSTISESNPLILPDQFLQTFMPTMLIRHPAIAFPSEYRAEIVARIAYKTEMRDAYSTLVLNYSYVRQLYDFYRAYFERLDPESPWPFVIDATDLIACPEVYMNRFCELTGIDSTKLRYKWQPLNVQQLESIGDDAVRRFLSTLNASTVVQADKAYETVDIDAEVAKFSAEFGDEVGRKMERWIRNSMADYEYVKSKRWLPKKNGHVSAESCPVVPS